MLKRIALLVFYLNLLPYSIWAQSKLRFAALGEFGLLAGVAEPSADARVSFGIKQNQFVLTAGAGIDAYRYITAPVFIQARQYFFKKQVKPLAYASLGVHVIADSDLKNIPTARIDDWWTWQRQNLKYTGGFYGDGGIGVAVGLRKKPQHRLYTTLGWSVKTMTEQYEIQGREPGEPDPVKNEFTMRRVILRFGFEF